ncbi:MAG: VOC family protein, partial [Solirubrobacteraceae bacterium]
MHASTSLDPTTAAAAVVAGTTVAAGTTASVGPSLPSDLSLGPVSLTVSDLGRARDFYERVLGLQAQP